MAINDDNVKIIRFLGGEEIIAEVMGSSGLGWMKVKNPVAIMVMPDKADPKTPRVGFAPWVQFTSDETIDVNESLVLTTMKPVEEFLSQYKNMFSAIKIPTTKIIMPS